MAESLLDALEKVNLNSQEAIPGDHFLDSILDEQRPHKRSKQDRGQLKLELEAKYLTPSTSFSTEWLNKLQQ